MSYPCTNSNSSTTCTPFLQKYLLENRGVLICIKLNSLFFLFKWFFYSFSVFIRRTMLTLLFTKRCNAGYLHSANKILYLQSVVTKLSRTSYFSTKLYCFRARVYCYYCLCIIFSANPVRHSEELRGALTIQYFHYLHNIQLLDTVPTRRASYTTNSQYSAYYEMFPLLAIRKSIPYFCNLLTIKYLHYLQNVKLLAIPTIHVPYM